jgi:RNA polymerase sigma-70 factor (ECF subfamily)
VDPKDPDLPPRAEALLSQSDWVRTLVRGLGVDESAADDVVQSTWVAALTRPPRAAGEGASLRAWIARVARNFALRRIDRDARRVVRERDFARAERLPSASDVVEREEARSQVVSALLEVHEPYRTTLLLRFYEGLEPRDIARVQKIPDSTVRNRLKRGLALLRERLEVSQGADWRQRCLLVLPALRAKPVWFPAPPKWIAATAASGGAIVVKTLAITAVVALAAGGMYLAWDRVDSKGMTRSKSELAAGATGSSASASSPSSAIASSHPRSSGTPTQLVAASPHSARAPVASTADEVVDAKDDGHRFALHGRLLSPDGKPLKTAPAPAVQLDSFFLGKVKTSITVSDMSIGRQDSTSARQDGEEALAASENLDSELSTDPTVGTEPTIRRDLAPEISIRGSASPQLMTKVIDASSASENPGLSDLTFAVNLVNRDMLLNRISDRRAAHVLVASSSGDARELDIDAEGGFQFGDLRPDHWTLFATAPGFLSRRTEFDVGREEKEKHLDMTLEPSPNLKVKLVTPDGHDLIKAVAEDPKLTATFIPVPFAMRDAPGPRVTDLGDAPAQPFASASWHHREGPDDKSAGDETGLLRLTDPLPLHVGVSVRGVVIDERLVASGTEEVVFVIPLDRIRALVSGVNLRVVSARDGLPIAGARVEVEGVESSVTDAQGAVDLPHVAPGSHQITIAAEGHERRVEWIEVEPGKKNDLGVRELGAATRVTGRVVDENGAPVQLGLQLRALDATAAGHSLPSTDETASDAEGRFVFEHAGQRKYLLSVEGEDWAAPVQTIDVREGVMPEIVVHASHSGELKLTFPIEPPPGSNYVVDTAEGIPVCVQPADGWQPLSVRLGNGEYRARIVAGGRTLWTRHVIIQPGQMIAFDEIVQRK